MRELRISRNQWEMLDELRQQDIKELSQDFADDFGLEWEYDYYWLRFNDEQFFLAKIKYAELFSKAFSRYE